MIAALLALALLQPLGRGALAAAPELESLASREVHEVLVFALLGLVALHVGGVVLQQVRRGGIARRMVPFLK